MLTRENVRHHGVIQAPWRPEERHEEEFPRGLGSEDLQRS